MMEPNQKEYYKKLYEELSEKYSKEELVESFVFPSSLSEEEQKKADQELWEFRKKRLLNRTPEQKILSGLLRIRYQIEDYLKSSFYDEEKTISKYLNDYMKVVDKKQKELAEDIGLHVTRMSRILNRKEKLSLSLSYRLEAHSGDLIPALIWWKLAQKEIEQEIMTNTDKKKQEREKVKNIVYERA